MPPPLAVYPLRQTSAEQARATLGVTLSCGALALGGFLFFKGLVALSCLLLAAGVAALVMRFRGAGGLVEDEGSMALFADRVEVRGLLTGDLEFGIEALEAHLETRKGVVLLGMAAPATIAAARFLVLRSGAAETRIPADWFLAPSVSTRFLRDLSEVRSGRPPSGPDAPVAEATRDELDDRIDREIARLPNED